MKADKLLIIALILFFIMVILGVGYLYFIGVNDGARCVSDPFGYIKSKYELNCFCTNPIK
jgi:hypothetical protein